MIANNMLVRNEGRRHPGRIIPALERAEAGDAHEGGARVLVYRLERRWDVGEDLPLDGYKEFGLTPVRVRMKKNARIFSKR